MSSAYTLDTFTATNESTIHPSHPTTHSSFAHDTQMSVSAVLLFLFVVVVVVACVAHFCMFLMVGLSSHYMFPCFVVRYKKKKNHTVDTTHITSPRKGWLINHRPPLPPTDDQQRDHRCPTCVDLLYSSLMHDWFDSMRRSLGLFAGGTHTHTHSHVLTFE